MNISNKTLRLIRITSGILSCLMIPLAYFRVLPGQVCYFLMAAFFAASIILGFVSDSRKVKEYSSKDDTWSKVKKYGIISNNLWFLFGVVLLLVMLILRAIIG